MKRVLLVLIAAAFGFAAQSQTLVIPNVWLNEIHYDNDGTDTAEGYEIAGEAGINLACFEVWFYTASGVGVYHIDTLSGTIDDEGCGYGAVWFPLEPIQNGPSDGVLLVYAPQHTGCGVNNIDTIIQFLSYEGVINATTGRGAGQTSVNIGVSENSNTLVGNSLQLYGAGTAYGQFFWHSPQPATPGTLNTNQYLCGAPLAEYHFSPVTATVAESAGTDTVGYVHATNVYLTTQTVEVQLLGGTGDATDVDNYTTQTFTFVPGGIDSLPLTLTITDDALNEGTENIVFALRNASNSGTMGADSLFGLSITDNDAVFPTVGFSLATSSALESVGMVHLGVSITNPDANPTSVDVMISGGSAVDGTDYTWGPTTITFPGGSNATQDVMVTITNDLLNEGSENLTLMLMNPTNNATIGTMNHTLTILDDDALSVTFNVTTASQSENNAVYNVAVQLLSSSPNATTVDVEYTGGTASTNNDFYFYDTTITWAANANGTVNVPIVIFNDQVYENNETVTLKLSNATNGAVLVDTVFLLTIINDDALNLGDCGDLFFSEYVEGSASNKAIEIFNPTGNSIDLSDYRVQLAYNGNQPTSVIQLNGTIPSMGTFVIAGSQSDTVLQNSADQISGVLTYNGDDALILLHLTDTLDIIGQVGVDPGTSWPVIGGTTVSHTLIRNAYQYNGNTSWASAATEWTAYPIDLFDSLHAHTMMPCGTIIPITINWVSMTQTVAENAGVITAVIEVNNPTNADILYGTQPVSLLTTASLGPDFTYNGLASFFASPGHSFDTLRLNVIDDNLMESTEVITMQLYGYPAGSVITDSIHTITITDNDALTVSYNGAGFSYTEDADTVYVRVTINGSSPNPTSVDISLAAGSATDGADFIFAPVTVTFPANNMDTILVPLVILEDNIEEQNEQINFNLTNATNSAQIAISAYSVTIIDNDTTVGIREEALQTAVAVFPNPASSTLTIRSQEPLKDVSVLNLLSEQVLSIGDVEPGTSVTDVSALAPGIYFLRVAQADVVVMKRFVKQ